MFNKLKNKAESILAKIAETCGKAKGACKAAVVAAGALVVSAQNSYAALEVPATAKADLEGYITDNFALVIGVTIMVVAVGLIIRMIKKAG
jgi:nitrogen fixation-related uncharacterized protein